MYIISVFCTKSMWQIIPMVKMALGSWGINCARKSQQQLLFSTLTSLFSVLFCPCLLHWVIWNWILWFWSQDVLHSYHSLTARVSSSLPNAPCSSKLTSPGASSTAELHGVACSEEAQDACHSFALLFINVTFGIAFLVCYQLTSSPPHLSSSVSNA